MQELSREEKEQEIARVERLIAEKDYAFDEEQWKRVKRTFFVTTGAIYLIGLYYLLDGGIGDINIAAMLSNISIDAIYGIFALLVLPMFIAGFIMFISYGVMFYIISGAIKKAETVSYWEGRLSEMRSNRYK